ncbi:hypothetical protein [Bradyrhizobium japonicum]|uniref:hypothetical protein n=1 Tax=Bradyrhizobium japonicum TaxID=375 RepID=UPI003B67E994
MDVETQNSGDAASTGTFVGKTLEIRRRLLGNEHRCSSNQEPIFMNRTRPLLIAVALVLIALFQGLGRAAGQEIALTPMEMV